MYEWLEWPLILVGLAFMTHGFTFVKVKHEHKHYYGRKGDAGDE